MNESINLQLGMSTNFCSK